MTKYKNIRHYYLQYVAHTTETWWTCTIVVVNLDERSSKPALPETPAFRGLAKELTEDEATEYSSLLGFGKCIQYNGTDIRIAPAWNSGYSLVIDLDLGDNLFRCGVLVGQESGYADNPSKVGDHIYISKEEGDECLKFCYPGSPKWVVYNSITKEVSTVDAPPPVTIEQSLSQQAKPLYQSTLASYGSGYLWNRFTKAQQKELTAYLDALDAIVHDEEHNATELPIKPDFIK